jgi:D-cysteine desulfhydrase family pyridoxal phosphate-dependent enzyme
MLPRLIFAHLPTPVEPLARLSAALNSPPLFIKRDDQTGLASGGNKTRKLEFLLAEAQAHGARTLITSGAAQSNHCRQTAAAAARYGFDCILVLSGDPAEKPTGNLLLDHLLGAEIIWTSRDHRDDSLAQTFKDAWSDGRRPYLIPYGGSNPVGASGYVLAMDELASQNINPDWIVFASSSGGTQAGMVVGAARTAWRGKVLGISVDERQDVLQARVANLATATAELWHLDRTFQPEEILVNASYLGGGYGVMGEAEREAIHLFARHEGILLDPVYTSRAAAGLIDLIRQGSFKPGETILFWHTGGAPALFSDRYAGQLP